MATTTLNRLDRRPVRRESVDFRVLSDLSSVVVDPADGMAHALNPVATAVFERCDGTLTAGEIVAEVVAIFDGPPDLIAHDIETFLDGLDKQGLIEW
jgi:hypothetical protein